MSATCSVVKKRVRTYVEPCQYLASAFCTAIQVTLTTTENVSENMPMGHSLRIHLWRGGGFLRQTVFFPRSQIRIALRRRTQMVVCGSVLVLWSRVICVALSQPDNPASWRPNKSLLCDGCGTHNDADGTLLRAVRSRAVAFRLHRAPPIASEGGGRGRESEFSAIIQ